MSISWHIDAEPRPALLVLPPAAASLDEAHAAIELWEHYSGKRLDPTQRLTVEVMMAQVSDGGNWAAQTTGREMPRQNGKGDELEVVELWGLIQRDEAILHTIHDAVLLATQTQDRMLGLLAKPDLRRKVLRSWKGTGQQMIEMRGGGIIWYRTRTGGGGRGVDDIDRLVVDEAQHATSEQLAALTPTLLVNPNPQINVVGTAGLEGKSEWWWDIRKRALSPDPGDFGYVGHTAEQVRMDGDRVVQIAPDVEDRSLWPTVNPALHAGRGRGMAFFEEQRKNLGAEMFAQEHLCVWAPPPKGHADRIISPELWSDLQQMSQVDSDFHWSLAISPDRKWSTIGFAGRRADGLFHVEVGDNRPMHVVHEGEDPEQATLVARCKAIWEQEKVPCRIHVKKGSPEAAYVDLLREQGVEVDEVSSVDYAEAVGVFIDSANGRMLRHVGQGSLTGALERADVRNGEWVERTVGADITPLRAVTVALGGVPTTESDGPSKPMFAVT